MGLLYKIQDIISRLMSYFTVILIVFLIEIVSNDNISTDGTNESR